MTGPTCPSCETSYATASLAVCPACGHDLASGDDPPTVPVADEPEPGTDTGTAEAPTDDHGPPGTRRSPGKVVLLMLVTLGVYKLYWLWKTSREIDRFAGDGRSAHKVVKWGAVPFAIGMALVVVMPIVLVLGAPAPAAQPELARTDGEAAPAGEDVPAAQIWAGLSRLAGLLPYAIGGILLLVGLWRLWSKIRDWQVAHDMRDPLSPGMNLALSLIPIVNIAGALYVDYRTQKDLNRLWDRVEGGSGETPVQSR